jgi:TolB protein
MPSQAASPIAALVRALMLGGLLTVGACAASPADRTAQRFGVAFASFAPVNSDLFTADADGKNERPLRPDSALDYNASFSTDGRWIVFTSNRHGSADIYRVGSNGEGLERLTHHPAFDDQGVLSPDGRFLAFVSSRTGQADIWILDLAIGALRNLTHHPGGDFRPAWSPHGKSIAFSSDRGSKKERFSFVTLHAAEIFVISVDGKQLRQVTHTGTFAGSPAWSTDGEQLVYYEASLAEVQKITSPRRLRGVTQIVSLHLRSGQATVLTSGAGEKWSPQPLAGARLGYVSGGPEGGVEFVGAPAGARGEFRNPRWSADGRRMVFQREVDARWPPHEPWPGAEPSVALVRSGVFANYTADGAALLLNDQRAGALHNSILIMKADGSGRRLLFGDAQKSALAPVWSPDGDRIAFGFGGFFQTTGGLAAADVAVIDADGGNLKILTDSKANVGLPSWSPDGRRLVYREAGKARNGLSIVDVATGVSTVLSTGASHENFPAWSPLGDRIAFTSDRDGDYDIYTVKADGTDVRRLTRTPGNDAHNAWSPDGKWIAFTSARGGFKDEAPLHPYNPQPYGDLYIMRANGSGVRALTDDQFEDGTPTWFVRPPSR